MSDSVLRLGQENFAIKYKTMIEIEIIDAEFGKSEGISLWQPWTTILLQFDICKTLIRVVEHVLGLTEN